MNWALIKKGLDESKWLLGCCFFAVILICAIRIWIVSQIETGNFKQIIEWLPGDLERFSNVPFGWLISYPGRIALTYQEPVIVLCLGVWCISRGSDCVSGEIGRGTMEMLLAQPVSRSQLLISHILVTVFGVGLIALATLLGVWIGIELTTVHEKIYPTIEIFRTQIPIPFLAPEEFDTPMREKASIGLFVPAAVNFFTFGIMLAGLTVLMSSWDRYRWRTIGIITAFHIAQVLAKLLGMSAAKFSWVLYFTIYSAYEPEALVRIGELHPDQFWAFSCEIDGVRKLSAIGYNAVLLAAGMLGFIGAIWIFRRRDLPAPT